MEKTSEDIEADVYRILKESALKKAIGGQVLRDGRRKKGATTEDAVVKFLSGIDGQEQFGVVLIHIYVPNKAFSDDGELSKDTPRIRELQRVVNSVIANDFDNNTEYVFEKDGTPQSYPVEGIEQHFINVRLKYRRKTF